MEYLPIISASLIVIGTIITAVGIRRRVKRGDWK